MSETLLIEIGTEELPPKALLRLAQTFETEISSALAKAQFGFAGTRFYATPRRLAVSVLELVAEQADRREQRRGPALKAAFDADGNPTKAALGFARSCGVDIAELGRTSNEKGDQWLAFERDIAGVHIKNVIADVVHSALDKLPIPKRMRWGSGATEFVRPVHWVNVLYGSDVLDCEILGFPAGRSTRGHRFHCPDPLTITHANEYSDLLKSSGHVLASFEERRQAIVDLISHGGDDFEGDAVIDGALLDEVTALVEWPVLVVGQFDENFLRLPEEVLIASMQEHQKYFPVRTADGTLSNRFITISNIESRDPAIVRDGNERVIRPRLSDADFFYSTDRKSRLEQRLEDLANVTFEKRLGSVLDKTHRVATITREIATDCGADIEQSGRAAILSRCDLLSAMVGEFPELQGTMGSYYATADGESGAVAIALGEFYSPRFAGDEIAASPEGRAIAIADRLDSLVGIFGIGSAPTGDKDPYALRRAALGVIRTLIEGDIDLDLAATLEIVFAGYESEKLQTDTCQQVYQFMRERMRGYYLDHGTSSDVCNAVLSNNPTSPLEVALRINAVNEFRKHAAASALAAANKRISNILKKVESSPSSRWQSELLRDDAEVGLADKLNGIRESADQFFEDRDYNAYLETLAGLRGPIDSFFDNVMVMDDNMALRENRIAMLAEIHALFTRVADIAQLGDH